MIRLVAGDVSAEVVPERGALVTALRVGDRDVLYLDRTTLDDPTKNVRGGIPLLFPYAGKRPNMKQHGFARDRAWTVTEQTGDAVRMTLIADADTRAQYPYPFIAHHHVRLLPRGIQLELTIVAEDAALPVSPGWHPYFTTDDKTEISTEPEFDFGKVAPVDGRSKFTVPALSIEASPEMRHLQFWTQVGKPFVCIEPFYGPAGTIDTDARGIVPAGAARTFWMRILV